MKEVPIHFILGFPRSGTTLLMGMCRTHPEIETDVQEPNHIYRLINDPYFNYAGYQKEYGLHPPGLHNMYYDSVRLFVEDYYKKLCARSGRGKVVIKHPWLTKWIHRVSLTFPEAKILVMLRHPYDVVASTLEMSRLDTAKEMFGGLRNLDEVCRQYACAMNEVISVTPELEKNKRVMFLKYEDLVESPIDCLQHVFQFYGVDFGKLRVRKVVDDMQTNQGGLKDVCLQQTRFYKARSRWKLDMDEHQRQRVRALVRLFAFKFGYDEEY
jgi:hypothetical protein